MPDVLLDTKFWTVLPTITPVDNTGSGIIMSHLQWGSAAATHDSSDSTRSTYDAADEASIPANADATWTVARALNTGAIAGTISFIRVRVRGHCYSSPTTDDSRVICTIEHFTRGGMLGAPIQMSFGHGTAWYERDYTVDPLDGLAWTSAKVTSGSYGFALRLVSLDDGYATNCEAEVGEFIVEVWGTTGTTQTITPTSVAVTAAASASTAQATGAATITPAAVPLTTASSTTLALGTGTVTGFPISVPMNASPSLSGLLVVPAGAATIAPASVGATAAVGAATRTPSGTAVVAPASTGMVATPGAAAATSASGVLLPASVGAFAAAGVPTMQRIITPASVGALAVVGAPALLPATVRLFPLSVGMALSVGLPDTFIDTGQPGTTITRDFAVGAWRVAKVVQTTSIGG